MTVHFCQLAAILADKFRINKAPWGGILKLRDRKSKMRVNISGISALGLIAIKLPDNQHAYFKDAYGKVCDFFVIAPRRDGADVFLCELKETLRISDMEHICQQIKCSIPLFWYLNKALSVHFGDGEKIRTHFVIIAKRRGAQKMRSIRTTYGTVKEKPVHLNGRKIQIISDLETIPLERLYPQ